LRRSKQKRAHQPHALERLRNDARFERENVCGNIREFRHAYQLAGGACVFATWLFRRNKFEISGAYYLSLLPSGT
jgi:hypothetical protein